MTDLLLFAWRRYLDNLQTKPLTTKAITTGLVSFTSEFTAQKLQGVLPLNTIRLMKATAYGLLYLGPYMHYYHKLMDYLFEGRNDLWTVIAKVVVEQLTSGPLNNFIYLMFANAVLTEEMNFKKAFRNVREQFVPVQLKSWTFWPAVSFVNNLIVPLQFRVLVASIAAFAWTVYLIREGGPRKPPTPNGEDDKIEDTKDL